MGPYRTVGAAQGFITCVGGAGNAVVALGVVLQQRNQPGLESVEIGDREWVGPYRTVGAAQGFITCVGGAGNAVVALGVVLQQGTSRG